MEPWVPRSCPWPPGVVGAERASAGGGGGDTTQPAHFGGSHLRGDHQVEPFDLAGDHPRPVGRHDRSRSLARDRPSIDSPHRTGQRAQVGSHLRLVAGDVRGTRARGGEAGAQQRQPDREQPDRRRAAVSRSHGAGPGGCDSGRPGSTAATAVAVTVTDRVRAPSKGTGARTVARTVSPSTSMARSAPGGTAG